MSFHYNGDNSYLFVKGVEQLKFKTNANQRKRNPLCLENLSSDWSITNAAKTELHGYDYDFAVDYVPISGVKTIYDIHRCLMTKRNII